MKTLILPLLSLVVSFYVCAGDSPETQPSLDQQFHLLRENVTVVEQYRMVKALQVEQFWRAVKDTLKQKDAAVAGIKEEMSGINQQLAALQADLDKRTQEMESMQLAATSIHLLGMDVRKEKFLLYTGVGMLILIFLTGVALYAFRMSYQRASESRSLYDDVCREYETYKHRMVEKEVKILRELQDYRNRFVELKSA
ncbi:MAG: hypothetical protein MUE95_15845 [Cyclobacteriaceae bacterium]|jgi:hypothetical protein|nr:hypothetical protein [Cyclobacteriaceae bacterium]